MVDLIFIRLSILRIQIFTKENIVDTVLLLTTYFVLFFLLFNFSSKPNSFLEPANLILLCLVITKEIVRLYMILFQIRKNRIV